MLTDQELQSLRNLGNDAERAADEIERLRALLDRVANCKRYDGGNGWVALVIPNGLMIDLKA